MVYNDWIRTSSRGWGIDGYTEVEIKDMQGNWLVVARFQEADDYKTGKIQAFVREQLYKGQPSRHATV